MSTCGKPYGRFQKLVNFMFTTYVTDELIADAYSDVTNYRPSSCMYEKAFAHKLCDKSLCCRNVFSDRGLKFIFVKNLLLVIRSKVIKYLTSHPHMGLNALVR